MFFRMYEDHSVLLTSSMFTVLCEWINPETNEC